MDEQLQFIPFKSRTDKGWDEAWDLYEASFPHCERWNADSYDRAFGDPHFEADGIWRGGEFIGILFHWKAGNFHYVEHLAVSPRLRGQNMGSKALAAFAEGKRVILEIDPPRMKYRSAACISTSGSDSSRTPRSTSTPRSAGRSMPTGSC